jgi:hypothetical protein
MNDRAWDSSARRIVIGLAIAMAAGSLGYRVLVSKHLEQTAALFIGLPAVLAILVALTRPPKSATGVILKAMTLLLLLSGILLGEGFICIVMAAPLFYLVGFVIGRIIDFAEKKRQRRLGKSFYGLVLLPFLSLSLEGVYPSLSFPRREVVTVERIVRGATTEVERALAETPHFTRPLPLYLRLRFPRPAAAEGAGLSTGELRRIHFAGGEGRPGDLLLRVAEHGPGHARFLAVSDGSHIAHWLDWREADVHWSAERPGWTRVTWTLCYERRLDPAWYFGPWERYAVRLAAGYLVDNTATPAAASTP